MNKKEILLLTPEVNAVISSDKLSSANKIDRDRDENIIFDKKGNSTIFMGDFANFHLYILISCTKFKIIPNSIQIPDKNKDIFEANIKYFDLIEKKEIISKFCFRSPYVTPQTNQITGETRHTLHGIEISTAYYSEELCDNREADGFSFKFIEKEQTRKVPLDLTFFAYCQNPHKFLPLFVEYIGIAEKFGKRDAIERLSKGHSHLGEITSEIVKKYPYKDCFACFYRFDDENFSAIKDFTTTLKTLEATLIQYFKPEYNENMINFPKDKTIELVKEIKKLGIEKITARLKPYQNCIFISDTISYPQNLDDNSQNIHLIQIDI